MTQRLMWILWPAFLVAGIAEGIVFSLFDPHDMHLFGMPVNLDRHGGLFARLFSVLGFRRGIERANLFAAAPPFEVNRCPLPQSERPQGCPRRGQPGACC